MNKTTVDKGVEQVAEIPECRMWDSEAINSGDTLPLLGLMRQGKRKKERDRQSVVKRHLEKNIIFCQGTQLTHSDPTRRVPGE